MFLEVDYLEFRFMIPLTYQPVRDSAFKLQDVVEEEVGLINFVTSDF